MPLFNDEDYVRAALDSCLAQTLDDIEVVCVDDASTDGTADVVEQYARRDPRVRLVRQSVNRSAFQARRIGIQEASAPYVLFLDGDDELTPQAAEIVLRRAEVADADVVGFGVEVVTPGHGRPPRMEAALQPTRDEIHGRAILPTLFPPGKSPNGHLWRYLFATDLLRSAYEEFSPGLVFHRANDLPISFLALALARKYVSVRQRLYRYYFRRGTSGHSIADVEHFRFLLSGVDPITAISPQVRALAERVDDGALLIRTYESARLHVIAHVLRYCIRDTTGGVQAECLDLLKQHVGELTAIRAAAISCKEALPALSRAAGAPMRRPVVRRVMLTTRNLGTGGVQAVVCRQAEMLSAAGYDVTVAVMERVADERTLPAEIPIVRVAGASRLARLDAWLAICEQRDIDIVLDHHVLYNENWPWFALVALARNIPTIGWVHSFSLRPLFDNTQRLSFLTVHARILLQMITLSPTDVAFWKLQGVEHVAYLPNPLSSLAERAISVGRPRELSDRPIELAWWGRIDRPTKQVHHLVDIAQRLRSRGVPFHLTIMGPDSPSLTATQLRAAADAQGVNDVIDVLGEQTAEELLSRLSGVDLLVSTSAMEGYQLAIIEAQALGVPVVMYEIPWLTTVRDNAGIVSVSQGDIPSMVEAIGAISTDRRRYAQLSAASYDFARTVAEENLAERLQDLLEGALPPAFSPAATVADASTLVEMLVRISERNIRVARRRSENAQTVDDKVAREVSALRRDRDRAQGKLREIVEGPSFKIGRMITYVPRAVRRALRSLWSSARRRKHLTTAKALPRSIASPSQNTRARSKDPDVSVVIPVFNSVAWLSDCVSSVLSQSGVDIEIIAINDGSTDGSLEVLRSFAKADQRVIVLDQPNSGQSVGRNRGLDVARGRYVIYLDSDDHWPADVLATLVRRADRDELDVLLFDCSAFLDGDVDESIWKRYSKYYQRAHSYREVRTGVDLMVAMRERKEYRPHVGLYLARTSYVRRTGVRFIAGIVHQDNPYTFRLLLNAQRAAHEPLNAYARRVRPGSTITTLTAEKSARGYYLSYLEMIRELRDRRLSTDHEKVVNGIVDSVYEAVLNQFPLLAREAAEELRELDPLPDAQAVWRALECGRKLELTSAPASR